MTTPTLSRETFELARVLRCNAQPERWFQLEPSRDSTNTRDHVMTTTKAELERRFKRLGISPADVKRLVAREWAKAKAAGRRTAGRQRRR